MPVSRSILNLARWRQETPKVLQAGRVDAYVGAVAAGLVGVKSFQDVRYTRTTSWNSGVTVDLTLGTSVNVSRSIVLYLSHYTFVNWTYTHAPDSSHNSSGTQRSAVWTPRLTGPSTLQLTARWGAYSVGSGSDIQSLTSVDLHYVLGVMEFY